MEKPCYIYFLHKGDGVPFYLGKTNNVKDRFYKHRKNFGLLTQLEILDIVNVAEWKFWERYWVSQFLAWGFNLLNKNFGGNGPTHLSPTQIQKIKNSRPKTNPKLSIQRKGYQYPESRNLKTSQALQGHLPFHKKAVVQYDKNNNFIKEWDNIRQVRLNLKISTNNIHTALQDFTKSAGGFRWKYKN